MVSLTAKTFLALAVSATVMMPLQPALARDWERRHDRGGEAVAIGVLGLAAGLMVGSALNQPSAPRYEERIYIDPPVRRYPTPDYRVYEAPAPRQFYGARPVYETRPAYRPQPVYGAAPWSRAWYDYCSQRYRSFNPRNGTFTDYDGQRHFCVAG